MPSKLERGGVVFGFVVVVAAAIWLQAAPLPAVSACSSAACGACAPICRADDEIGVAFREGRGIGRLDGKDLQERHHHGNLVDIGFAQRHVAAAIQTV